MAMAEQTFYSVPILSQEQYSSMRIRRYALSDAQKHTLRASLLSYVFNIGSLLGVLGTVAIMLMGMGIVAFGVGAWTHISRTNKIKSEFEKRQESLVNNIQVL